MDHDKTRDPNLWDCDSALYDSFELRSFRQQLDSALGTRCLSMPRLSDQYLHPIVPPVKKRSRVLRSVHKFIRAVFRLKGSSATVRRNMMECEIYGGYVSSDRLTTIPEGCEKGHESSPDFDPQAVTKTLSERYTSSTSGGSELPS
ncbi:uncharacterized protein A4U43_C01F26380 [Asparagus officinalis]|uniref:Uncharacterized protein n=1 Tax=Asparagus officinalis TaxID=4686 RepID=A0A1R3L5N3_ASPOF|nr:uncharacterized protein A4U43_UnF9750 [Asparagus officinalis]ONK81199.1 uncharacterized protein A4U43_C01F26380 [Asparagus officinalis]